MKHTPEMTKAISGLTCTNVFFTALLYNLKIEGRDDLPGQSCGATDGVHLYYHPDRFAKMLNAAQRQWLIVHELLHVILFHNTRRGIRNPERWNIACDHAVNLLCDEYGFKTPPGRYCDAQYKGMTAEQIYDKLPEDAGESDGDVLDYDPSQNDGQSKGDLEREIAIGTEKAAQAAKAAGTDSAALKRIIGNAQVQREPWYQHLRRYITSLHSRQYNWSRIDARRAVLHGVVSPVQKTESMGKLVMLVDESGSMTDRQRAAISAHISDICKDVSPSSIVVAAFDTEVVHSEEFTGPDYAIEMVRHACGGTDFGNAINWVLENHSDAQLILCFTDLFGPFGEEPGLPVLWISQTETIDVPFGELIYGDLNEG